MKSRPDVNIHYRVKNFGRSRLLANDVEKSPGGFLDESPSSRFFFFSELMLNFPGGRPAGLPDGDKGLKGITAICSI